MMGHGYYGNVRDQSKYIRQFAWWPIRSTSGKRIWMKYYYEKRIFYDNNGRPPIKGLHWTRIYTAEEYFLLKLTGKE